MITATASDGLLSSSQMFTINVIDQAPLTPSDRNKAQNVVLETTQNGTLVGITASASDAAFTTVTYSLTNDAGGRFAIDSTTGVVTVANASLLDFEANSSHVITVQASDGTLSSSAPFRIKVLNAPPGFASDIDSAATAVPEDTQNGALVGLTVQFVEMGGQPISYSLTSNGNGAFAIDPTTGVVSVADATLLDFEVRPIITLIATASDGLLTSNANFVVNVLNSAPAAPFNSDSTLEIVVEGDPAGTYTGLTVASVSTFDPTVTYSFAPGGNGGGAFAINSTTGVVSIANAAVIDYETSDLIDVIVRVSDGVLFTDSTFTIFVDDAEPIFAASSGDVASVKENADTGTSTGLSALASDPNGGTVVYSLLDDAGGRFAINAGTGIVTVLNGGALLDFETQSSHVITVSADDGVLAAIQDFTIQVANVVPNEAVDTDAAADAVNENAPAGTPVGITLLATDPSGGLVTYSMVDDAGGRFQIDASTGVITVKNGALLDFEKAQSYSVIAGVSDGVLTRDEIVQIAVNNINESFTVTSGPLFNPSPASSGVPVVGTIVLTDPENNATVTWQFGDGSSAAGATVTKIYTVAGTYNGTVTVSDGATTQDFPFVLIVQDLSPDGDYDKDGIPNRLDPDSDNDGIPDDIELASGTDPFDASSVPFTLVGSNLLAVAKAQIKLNFNAKKLSADSVGFSGSFILPESSKIGGQTLIANIGGVVKSFVLNEKGQSPKANSTVKVTVKSKNGLVLEQSAKIQVRFLKENFKSFFTDEGLTDRTTKSEQVNLKCDVVLDGRVYSSSRTFLYTAKSGNSGSLK